MKSHYRVIPRDLFNDSKLLKCMARVALLAHDGRIGSWSLSYDPYEEEGGPFRIEQNPHTGVLFVANLYFRNSRGGEEIHLHSPYNDRGPWPLCFETDDGETSGPCFLNDGSLTPDFIEVLQLPVESNPNPNHK